MCERASSIRLFAFDLDGTLYLGDEPLPGAIDLIDYLRPRYQVVFLSNNSSRTRAEIHAKLNAMGIMSALDEVYATSTATALYLRETGINDVYVIGSEGFRDELRRNEIRVVQDESAQNLVVGHDPGFNYGKIQAALSVLLGGGKFIACNEDGCFPVGGGRFLPGCGSMVGAMVGASGMKPDYVVGKPNTYILAKIAKGFGVQHDQIMVVGDSYESDIVMALSNDSKAILLGSDDVTRSERVPVMEDLHNVLQYIKEI